MTEFEMIAKTFQGLEEVLAKELIELGANNVAIGNRMVSFTGDKALLYKANFHLRTAIRILKPFKHFKAASADEVYDICRGIDWEKYMGLNTSFAVDSVVNSEDFKHSKFVAYRVKDAIADWFRDKYGKRPNVSVANPDLTFHIHISNDDCSLSLDSSGESLHRRGYRQEAMEAPLNEVLAAGMLLMAGWNGQCDFIDPMCGSGTLPIEAALIARNMAPGLFRSQFAFEKWNDFDKDLFEAIYNDDSQEREFNGHIYGYDIDPRAILTAKRNAKAAGLLQDISFEQRDIKDFQQPENKAMMVTNPPYGERLVSDDLLGLYETLGERLKHAFMGCEAWIITYHYECFDKIGLKPSAKIPLFNGNLACEFRKYEIFSGKYEHFRGSDGHLSGDGVPTRRGQTLRQRARQEEKMAAKAEVESQEQQTEERTERKPFRKNFEDRSERPARRSSFRKEDGSERPRRSSYGKGGEERKSFSDRKPKSFGDKKPKSFGDRKPGFSKSSDGKSSDGKSSFSKGRKPGFKTSGKAPFSGERTGASDSGHRRSYGGDKKFSDRKSFSRKPAGKSSGRAVTTGDRPKRNYNKSKEE